MRAILLCALWLPVSVLAQEGTPAAAPDRPPFTLKTVPFTLINPFQQSVDLQADVPLSGRWGLDLGIGAILDSWPLASFKDESYRGLKVKPALKYYIKRKASEDLYLALGFKYHLVRHDRYDNILRQGGQYAEWMLVRRNLTVWGTNLRMGSQVYIGERKRWMIEPFFGLGYRQLHVSRDVLPPDAEAQDFQSGFNFELEPGTHNLADFLVGFHFGWVRR
jgi:hypothetical protein